MSAVQIYPSNETENGSLLLDVPAALIEIPTWLRTFSNTEGYKPKEEYHVTVIGQDLAASIHDLGKTDDVQALIERFSWTIELSDHFVELANDDENGIHRQSIIVIVGVPELEHFYIELAKIVHTEFDKAPAHVTLYTKNYDRGIGLYNYNDITRYKVRDLSPATIGTK